MEQGRRVDASDMEALLKPPSAAPQQHLLRVDGGATHQRGNVRSNSMRQRARVNDGSRSPRVAQLSAMGGETGDMRGRRNSTPGELRRRSTGRATLGQSYGWPAASDVKPSLLLPPDADNYTRMRQFDIDSKGCVVNRGDSFQRRGCENGDEQRSGTPSDQQEPSTALAAAADDSSSAASYDIYVLGSTGAGKTSLINQLMTSEHRNPFAAENDAPTENSVSVAIDGVITELIFFEGGTEQDQLSLARLASAYIVMFGVNSKKSWQHASRVVEQLRNLPHLAARPIVLVANKVDLARKRLVTADQCRTLASKTSQARSAGPNGSPARDLLHGDASTALQLRLSNSMRRFSQRCNKQLGSAVASGNHQSGVGQNESGCMGLVGRIWRLVRHPTAAIRAVGHSATS